MSAIDDLIKRAIETDALPIDEIQEFAEEVGKGDVFDQLVADPVAAEE